MSPPGTVGSCPTISPLLIPQFGTGGIFSVALSVGSPRLRHSPARSPEPAAMWSPDFPPRPKSERLPGPLLKFLPVAANSTRHPLLNRLSTPLLLKASALPATVASNPDLNISLTGYPNINSRSNFSFCVSSCLPCCRNHDYSSLSLIRHAVLARSGNHCLPEFQTQRTTYLQNNQLTTRPHTKFATAGLFRKFSPFQQCPVQKVRKAAGAYLPFLTVHRRIVLSRLCRRPRTPIAG